MLNCSAHAIEVAEILQEGGFALSRRIWIQSTIVNAGKGLLDQSCRFSRKS